MDGQHGFEPVDAEFEFMGGFAGAEDGAEEVGDVGCWEGVDDEVDVRRGDGGVDLVDEGCLVEAEGDDQSAEVGFGSEGGEGRVRGGVHVEVEGVEGGGGLVGGAAAD